MGPLMNGVANLTFLVVAVGGAWCALEGWITVGVISAFIIYSKQFTRPVSELSMLWSQIQTAVVTWSWRAIYADNEGAFNGMVQQMIQQANNYGYADCVKWCEEQAALCWAAQQAQAAGQ